MKKLFPFFFMLIASCTTPKIPLTELKLSPNNTLIVINGNIEYYNDTGTIFSGTRIERMPSERCFMHLRDQDNWPPKTSEIVSLEHNEYQAADFQNVQNIALEDIECLMTFDRDGHRTAIESIRAKLVPGKINYLGDFKIKWLPNRSSMSEALLGGLGTNTGDISIKRINNIENAKKSFAHLPQFKNAEWISINWQNHPNLIQE